MVKLGKRQVTGYDFRYLGIERKNGGIYFWRFLIGKGIHGIRLVCDLPFLFVDKIL